MIHLYITSERDDRAAPEIGILQTGGEICGAEGGLAGSGSGGAARCGGAGRSGGIVITTGRVVCA